MGTMTSVYIIYAPIRLTTDTADESASSHKPMNRIGMPIAMAVSVAIIFLF